MILRDLNQYALVHWIHFHCVFLFSFSSSFHLLLISQTTIDILSDMFWIFTIISQIFEPIQIFGLILFLNSLIRFLSTFRILFPQYQKMWLVCAFTVGFDSLIICIDDISFIPTNGSSQCREILFTSLMWPLKSCCYVTFFSFFNLLLLFVFLLSHHPLES